MNSQNEQTIAAYQSSVQDYHDKSPQTVSDHIAEWLNDALDGIDKNAAILEIGGGTGKDADYIENLGYNVDRTDATQAFVDFQSAKGHKARLLNALTDELGKGYNLVLADAVLLHFDLDETKQVLGKVFAALNEGGKFAFSLKQGTGEELTDQKLGAIRYFRYWEPDAIKSELENVGFGDIDIRIAEDYRGPQKPDWLMIIAMKGTK